LKKALTIAISVVLVVGVAAGIFYGYKKYQANKNSKAVTSSQQQGPVSEPASPAIKSRPGEYLLYDPSQLAKASDGKVVLFFNAKWCSTCKQIDKDLKTAKIPDNLTILSVDYDKNIAMRKKYQVPFENSYVQVDQNGTIVNSWSGSEDLAEIVALAK
jgi:thiol-disulfide isomerase/thioredoxin